MRRLPSGSRFVRIPPPLSSSSYCGSAGLGRALSGAYSRIVLDVMLPGVRGFEVLRKIRAVSTVPVVMLTAHGDDVHRIVGLEIGTDDYLSKPFNPRELAARIHAVLRRATSTAPAISAAAPIPNPSAASTASNSKPAAWTASSSSFASRLTAPSR